MPLLRVLRLVKAADDRNALDDPVAEVGVGMINRLATYGRAHRELFQTGLVAGAPPDAYSRSGQLWAVDFGGTGIVQIAPL